VRGRLPEMPDESGYAGEPNPGGGRVASLVKAQFEPLVEIDGAYFCAQCASLARARLR
jgi:hypothetical protein